MNLAIISNVATPYRVHFHRRLAHELPEVRLHSLFTHAAADFRWRLELPPEIRPVSFATDDRPPTFSARGDLAKARAIWTYLRDEEIEAVILLGYNNLTLLKLLDRCHRAGIATFLLADSNIAGEVRKPTWLRRLKRRLLAWVLARCDGVMPMGRLGEQYFEHYGADRTRFFRVPYEPDYEFWSAIAPADLSAFCAEAGFDRLRKRIIYSGRLVEVKRVDLLIRSFVAVADERPDWDLVIAGDGPLRSSLEKLVPHALQERVHWLGFCESERLRCCYHAGHLLALPSDYEPWGVVVNEAMAAGLPVVASDVVGAAHELVTDGISGRIFPAGDRAALTIALHRATDESEHGKLRRHVPESLAAWRHEADPVAGVRAALASVETRLANGSYHHASRRHKPARSDRALTPSPLVGEGWGGGASVPKRSNHPHSSPPPSRGRE